MATLTRRTGNVLAGVLALTLTAGLVVRTSQAAFTASTQNAGNSLQAGTVVLTDDDSAAIMFTLTNVAPGESTVKCIEVEYAGTIDPGEVRFYTTSPLVAIDEDEAGMSDEVNITIEQGTALSTADTSTCAGFTPDGTTLTTTVTDWHDTYTDYDNSAGDWNPGVGPETRSYRVTLGLDASAGNAFQGDQIRGIGVVWEVSSAP